MGFTVWFFSESSDGQMRRLPTAQFQRFYEGRATLPDRRDDALRCAQVAVEVCGRRVARVLRVVWPRYATTPSGLIDAQHKEDAMRLAVRVLGGILDTEDVVDIDPHLARRERGRTHEWRPSELQLQQVANALNRAAIHPPVVAVAKGELVAL